jgi:hypothetical protein
MLPLGFSPGADLLVAISRREIQPKARRLVIPLRFIVRLCGPGLNGLITYDLIEQGKGM